MVDGEPELQATSLPSGIIVDGLPPVPVDQLDNVTSPPPLPYRDLNAPATPIPVIRKPALPQVPTEDLRDDPQSNNEPDLASKLETRYLITGNKVSIQDHKAFIPTLEETCLAFAQATQFMGYKSILEASQKKRSEVFVSNSLWSKHTYSPVIIKVILENAIFQKDIFALSSLHSLILAAWYVPPNEAREDSFLLRYKPFEKELWDIFNDALTQYQKAIQLPDTAGCSQKFFASFEHGDEGLERASNFVESLKNQDFYKMIQLTHDYVNLGKKTGKYDPHKSFKAILTDVLTLQLHTKKVNIQLEEKITSGKDKLLDLFNKLVTYFNERASSELLGSHDRHSIDLSKTPSFRRLNSTSASS